MEYTKAQLIQISKSDEDVIVNVLTMLMTHIDQLNNRVKELERQLGINSRNSSKSPSSDGLRTPKSMRKSGGENGAPKDHNGYILTMIDEPDHIEWHKIQSCSSCVTSLEDVAANGYIRRQVFDLPIPKIVVTEHRFEKKCCPIRSREQQASFLRNVKVSVQYGDSWTAWRAYLHTYQLLPLERISQLFKDLTGYQPSESTLLKHLSTFHEKLAPLEEQIQQEILKCPVLHADETGMRIENKTQWLHVVSHSNWTLYHVHEKRGKKRLMIMGFFPNMMAFLCMIFWHLTFQPAIPTNTRCVVPIFFASAKRLLTMLVANGRLICRNSYSIVG